MKKQTSLSKSLFEGAASILGAVASITGLIVALIWQFRAGGLEAFVAFVTLFVSFLFGAYSAYLAPFLKRLRHTRRVFLSYSHSHATLAKEIAEEIRKAGAKVWIDTDQIKPGQSIFEAVERGLRDADYFVPIITTKASPSMREEINRALSREVRVIPVIHKDGELPSEVKGARFIDLREDETGGIRELVENVS